MNNELSREKELGLNLIITPQKINFIKGEILTNILLQYKGMKERLDTDLIQWVGSKTNDPIAIVSRNINNSKNLQSDYFAMYVVATMLSPEEFVKLTPVVSIGNINNLSGLIEQSIHNYLNYEELCIHFGRNSFIIDGTISKKDVKSLFALQTNSNNDIDYNLGLDFPVFKNKKLYFSSRLQNISNQSLDPIIRLGVSDQVKWFNHMQVKASYYPIKLTTESSNISNYMEIKFSWHQNNWDIWYETLLSDEEYNDKLGLKYKVNPNLQLSVMGNQDKIFFGIISRECIDD